MKAEGVGSPWTLRNVAEQMLNKLIVTGLKLWLGVVFREDPLWDMKRLAQFSDSRLWSLL